MPEFIKRVWAEKFSLTDEQKADVKANRPVEWHGDPVKHNGADRYHALLTVGGTHQAIYEGQWLVKDSPNTHVLWDEQFKAQYSKAVTPEAPVATEPIRSEALEAFLKKHQPAEDPAKSEEPAGHGQFLRDEKGEIVGVEHVASKTTTPLPEPAEVTPEAPTATEPTVAPEAPAAENSSPELNGQSHE